MAAAAAPAAEYYVSPGGAGTVGTNWATAFTNLQDAVNASVTTNGDTIYMLAGTNWLTTNVLVAAKAGLTISGGYVGDGAPGATSKTLTVISPLSTLTNKNFGLFDVTNSTLTLERLHLREGRTQSRSGGAIRHRYGGSLTLQDCVLQSNYVYAASASANWGGGIYMADGSLALRNCTLADNRVSGVPYGNPQYGGGIACQNGPVTLEGCRFERNYISRDNQGGYYAQVYGGAAFLANAVASVSNCQFVGNWLRSRGSGTVSSEQMWGSAACAVGTGLLSMLGCTLSSNWSDHALGPGYVKGGAVYVQTSQADIRECVFLVNGTNGAAGHRC
jgi:hypothetical protein